jgi:hypothetical protein
MRYRKGSIALSQTRDYPLLRQVLHSELVTHNQLFELLRLDYCVSSRNAFNNRVLRLLRHGLLKRHDFLFPKHDVVYSISKMGVMELSGQGEHCVHSLNTLNSRSACSGLHHCLDLNEIQLSLKRTGCLVYWMPEVEIRSRNDLTNYGYWKYYDAVVEVRLAGQNCKFALEYERTPKSAQQYTAIRERIDQETSIDHFLYLVPNHDLLSFLAARFSDCKRAVYLGLFRDFLQQTFTSPVRRCGAPVSVQFASVLGNWKTTPRAGLLFPGIAV